MSFVREQSIRSSVLPTGKGMFVRGIFRIGGRGIDMERAFVVDGVIYDLYRGVWNTYTPQPGNHGWLDANWRLEHKQNPPPEGSKTLGEVLGFKLK